MKTPRQEYSGVACSYSSAPGLVLLLFFLFFSHGKGKSYWTDTYLDVHPCDETVTEIHPKPPHQRPLKMGEKT